MRHPQLVVYEGDGRLAEALRETAAARAWAVRQPRHPSAALRLVRSHGPSVLVLKLGRDPEGELALLEQVAGRGGDTAVVVVGDGLHARLADLAWELGADYVLLPSQSRERLPEIVAGLMPSEVGR